MAAVAYLNEARMKNINYADQKGLISPLIHVGQFKTNSEAVVGPYEMDVSIPYDDNTVEIAKELDIDMDVVNELEQVCNPSNLTCPKEDKVIVWNDPFNIPENVGLQTVKKWTECCRKRLDQTTKKTGYKSRYTDHQCQREIAISKMKPKNKQDTIKGLETVITMSYYFTRNITRFRSAPVNIRVLGSQKLTELKDSLPCEIGTQPVGDFTNFPDESKDTHVADIVKSGFFFFENVFYNDLREQKNIDLSSYILEWAKNSNLVIPEDFQCARMEDHTFDDLHLRLGVPYLFMHLGDCEHIIIFKDIRLLHPDDCLSRSAYPLHLSKTKSKVPACTVCNYFIACWLTREDELADQDPAFFCEQCFKMLHFDKGKKTGNFIAFPYTNVNLLDYPKL